MEVFTRVRKATTLTGHDAGVQTITDPAGGGFVLQDRETTTNTDTNTGLDIDTVDRQVTLTPQRGDAGEQWFTLRSDDMSRLVATSMGQSDPWPKLVDHPGKAGTVMEQTGVSKTQPRDSHFPSSGIEAQDRLRALRVAHGKRRNECGSQAHIAHVCIKRMNLHTDTDRKVASWRDQVLVCNRILCCIIGHFLRKVCCNDIEYSGIKVQLKTAAASFSLCKFERKKTSIFS